MVDQHAKIGRIITSQCPQALYCILYISQEHRISLNKMHLGGNINA